MALSRINAIGIGGSGPDITGLLDNPVAAPETKGKESFAAQLDRSLSEVNNLLNEADKKTTEMAVGKSENLHDAMIAVEKAETSFKFLVQLRNKAMEAYNEIIRMQV
jgi:flagellar hook-basal body complex protein FliE